jgi:sugar phosphate isomerase/epimerase
VRRAQPRAGPVPAVLGDPERHGVQVQEVEYLFEWATRVEGEVPQEMEQTSSMWPAPSVSGSCQCRAVSAGAGRRDRRRVAALCWRAGELTVALEFLPFGGVADLAAAWRVVRFADQPNGGLLIDFWYWRRSTTTFASIR